MLTVIQTSYEVGTFQSVVWITVEFQLCAYVIFPFVCRFFFFELRQNCVKSVNGFLDTLTLDSCNGKMDAWGLRPVLSYLDKMVFQGTTSRTPCKFWRHFRACCILAGICRRLCPNRRIPFRWCWREGHSLGIHNRFLETWQILQRVRRHFCDVTRKAFWRIWTYSCNKLLILPTSKLCCIVCRKRIEESSAEIQDCRCRKPYFRTFLSFHCREVRVPRIRCRMWTFQSERSMWW